MSLPKRPPLNNPIPNADIPNTPEEYIVKAPYWDAVVSGNLTVSEDGSLAIGGSTTPPLGETEVGSQYWNMPLGNGIGVWNGELRNVEPDFPPYGCRTDVFTYGVTDFTDAWRDCTFSSFPADIDTSSGTNFNYTWERCFNLTTFPPLDFSEGRSFEYSWAYSGLTTFPQINISSGVDFYATWYGCYNLSSIPALDSGNGEDFTYTWGLCTSLTSFPHLNVSSGTSFYGTWYGCSSLVSFPLIDVSNGTNFGFSWFGCNSLTAFPLLNVESGSSFRAAWRGCSSLVAFPKLIFGANAEFYALGPYGTWQNCTSLTTFPSGMFDNSLATDFTNAWKNCALSQQSVDNILVSLDTAGQENGIVDLNGGTSAYPSPVGIAARDNLVEKGWTVNLNTIVMQGLILNLDAGNPASYPGYGTVWNDLSGRGNDGTLVNGVSYDSANDGSLVFDGSNYASLSGFTDFEFGTGDFTLDIWFKLVTVTNDYQFLYNEAYGLSSNGLQVRFGDWGFSGRFQCGVDMSTESCWSTTHTQNDLVSQYEQVVFRRGSGVCSLWLRGSQQFLNREFFPGSGYTFTDLGNISLVDHIFFGEGLVGNVYAVKVYDRALSDSEIAQNYDALKGRFGL